MVHNCSVTGEARSDIEYIGITPAEKHCLLADANPGRSIPVPVDVVRGQRVLAIPSGSAGLGVQKPPARVAALSGGDHWRE